MKTLLLAAALFCLMTVMGYAQTTATTDVSKTISYQGMINAPDGAPIADGQYTITVSFYADANGASRVWQGTYPATVAKGVFNVMLGSGASPFTDTKIFNQPLWVGVQLGNGEEMRPLTALTSVPSALGIADSSITSSKMATNYVAGITVNGTPITGVGSTVNLVGAGATSLLYDQQTNSIIVNAAGAAAGTDTATGGFKNGGGKIAALNSPVSDDGSSTNIDVITMWTTRGATAANVSYIGDSKLSQTAGGVLQINGGTGCTSAALDVNGNINVASGDGYMINCTTVLQDPSANNTFVGAGAGSSAPAGNTNTAVGFNALSTAGTGGSSNTAMGYQALNANTANNNIAVGYKAMLLNTTGTNNTIVGYNALSTSTTAKENTAVGHQTLTANTSDGLTAVGFQALTANTSGTFNTAVGHDVLNTNTTGNYNTATGEHALAANTTGYDNDAYGYYALSSNTTIGGVIGMTNDAFGTLALTGNTTGESNDAFGYEALGATTTPNNNCGFGFKAGLSNITGANNTFIGYNTAATNTTGSNNTMLGFQADVGAANLTNATAVGNGAVAQVKDAFQLGNSSVCYVGTFAHIRSELPASTTVAAGSQAVGPTSTAITDVAGLVGVTAIPGATNGDYVKITFGGCAYKNPNVVITAADANTATQLWFVTNVSSTGFTISRQVPVFMNGTMACDCQWPQPTGTYTWYYHVIDTGTP